jgi:hypothetical protein
MHHIKIACKILFRARGINETKVMGMVVGLVLFCCPAVIWAEDFLGLAVPPGGQALTKTESRLEIVYDLSPHEVTDFYKNALKGEQDIKFKQRDAKTVIEDHGARLWHSITIEKDETGRTKVVILKDSWTWILGTLTLRFFGVFAVLLALYLAMAVTGAVISRAVKLWEAER